MPFRALLPPTVWPVRTEAVLFFICGFGSDRKLKVAGLGAVAGPPKTMSGGSNEPGAYCISPYSTTKIVSVKNYQI
jgi:hypothetical protein